MSYYDHKFFHLVLGFFYLYCVFTASYNPSKKSPKIFLGLSTLTLLITGFSLLDRFGIQMSGPYPSWVWAKLAIWSLLAILPPVVIKRFPQVAKRLCLFYILLFIAAAFFGIYKA